MIDFDLEDVMQNILNIIGLKSQEKGLKLISHISPEVPQALHGDPMRLGQILLNLCNNAVKFTDQGGEINVSVSVAEGSVSMSCETEDQIKLIFSVKDSGIGMSEEEQKNLFQSFSQANRSVTRKYDKKRNSRRCR